MTLRICMASQAAGAVGLGPLDEDFAISVFKPFLVRTGLNISLVPESGFGSLVDRQSLTYDGCIGSIQQNASDTMLGAAVLTDFGPSVTVVGVLTPDRPVITSVYYKYPDGYEGSRTHVLDFVAAFSPLTWSLTLTLVILLTFLLKKSASVTFQVLISCLLNQHSNSATVVMGSCTSLVYTLETLLCFFCTFFLTSMIKTEMVVMERPPTYDSYQDLLDNDTIPVWVKELDDQRWFKHAANGSIERKLWLRAQDRGISQSLMSITSILGNLDTIQKGAERRAAGINTEIGARAAVSNVCAIIRSRNLFPNGNAYMRHDPGSQESLRVHITPAGVERDQQMSRFGRRMVRAIETATLMPELSRKAGTMLQPPDGVVHQVMECVSGIVVMPDYGLVPVPLFHLWDLATLSSLLLFVSTLILVIERKRTRARFPRPRLIYCVTAAR